MNTRSIFSFFLVGSALLFGSVSAQAQVAADVLNTYDNSDSIASLYAWIGNVDQTNVTWDSSMNLYNVSASASSGAAKISVSYTGAPNEEFAVCGTWANGWPFDFGTVLDATYYRSLEFDIYIDPKSSLSVASRGTSFGDLEINLLCSVGGEDWVPVLIGKQTIPATITNVGWSHVEIPIDDTDSSLTVCTGWDVAQKSNADHTGPFTFWIDNLLLRAAPVPPLPRLISPEKITSTGLWMSTSTNKDYQFTRQNIYSPALSLVGQSAPVTYTFTVSDYPANNAGLEAHLFLIGNGWNGAPRKPSSDPIADWNAENLIYLQVVKSGDGSGSSWVMFKTNVAPGVIDRWDGQVFGRNTLAFLGSSTVLGKWSLTFQDQTNVTLSAPDGSVTNFLFPAEALPYFNDSANNYAMVGIQPMSPENVGFSVTFSDVGISSGGDVLFDAGIKKGVLDSHWRVTAGDPGGVVVIPPDSAFWVAWTLPARNFNLYAADPTNLSSWLSLEGAQTTIFDQKQWTILSKSFVSTNHLETNAFFQLINFGQ